MPKNRLILSRQRSLKRAEPRGKKYDNFPIHLVGDPGKSRTLIRYS